MPVWTVAYPSGPSPNDICLVARTYTATAGSGGGLPVGNTITLTFQTDGDLAVTRAIPAGSGTPNADEWHCNNIIAGLGDDWEIRATRTAGTDPTSGTLNTWEALSSNRAWANTVLSIPPATVTSTLTFDFRAAGGSTILATVTGVVLTAQVT